MENREILQFDLKQLTSAGWLFKRLSGIDPDNVPEKYGSSIEDARKLVEDNCTVKVVYRKLPVTDRTENGIITADGIEIVSEMIPKVLADSQEFYCFVATLAGFDSLQTDDMMAQYCADTWGSAFVEAGHMQFVAEINNQLEEQGFSRTHVWSPGQHSFELSNQVPIFQLLQPEDIGCTLTPSMLMMPVKSSSGLFGIIPGDMIVNLKPCDFCQFQKSCPNSKSGQCTSL